MLDLTPAPCFEKSQPRRLFERLLGRETVNYEYLCAKRRLSRGRSPHATNENTHRIVCLQAAHRYTRRAVCFTRPDSTDTCSVCVYVWTKKYVFLHKVHALVLFRLLAVVACVYGCIVCFLCFVFCSRFLSVFRTRALGGVLPAHQ